MGILQKVLPIGDRFTMGPREVEKALELLDVDTIIPMHFGTFPELTGRPESLNEISAKLVTPIPGKSIELGE